MGRGGATAGAMLLLLLGGVLAVASGGGPGHFRATVINQTAWEALQNGTPPSALCKWLPFLLGC
jgi:hypothetical protein